MVAMVCDGLRKIARGWKTSREVGNDRKEIGSDKNKCGGTGGTGSPLTLPPLLRARRLDAPRSPGVCGVRMREGYVVEGGGINVARGAGGQAMEFRYDVRGMSCAMYAP